MPIGPCYQFGCFRLDTGGRVLFRDGKRVALSPKAVDVLVALLEAREQPVGKDELLRRVWVGTIVEEGSLTSHISLLRKTLGDENGAGFIETIPKRGYRFVGQVLVVAPPESLAVQRLTLVVLPFESLNGGDKHDYFSEGLTEEMITQLAKLSPQRLGVIARTSAMRYKSTTKSVLQIGRELAVSHVLEGSVRRAGDRVRITAQLIRSSDETHLWAESYERSLHDILALQVDVARAIAREIEIKLTPPEQQRLDRTAAVGAEAHEAYLKGRHFWYQRTEEGMRKSIECFELAIARQPDYAAAFDGIADAYTMLACRGVMPARKTFDKAKRAARQALQIDPDLGEACASLAHVRLHDWDWIGLEQDFERAIELNPGHAIAHYWYAEYLMATGRDTESIARVKQSQQMDPLNSVLNGSAGMILYLARQFDQAKEELDRALEIDPNHFLLHFRLGLVYQQLKRFDEAIGEMRKAVTLSGKSTEALTGLAQAYAAADMRAPMQEIVDTLVMESTAHYVSPYSLGRVYGSIEDKEQTFAWLQEAYDEHHPDLIELPTEPAFDSVRSDPRFRQLLSRVGFVDASAAGPSRKSSP
ncbi:MAG: tetratricopeptide repeat protein [Betaproteobacteria bacterium]